MVQRHNCRLHVSGEQMSIHWGKYQCIKTPARFSGYPSPFSHISSCNTRQLLFTSYTLCTDLPCAFSTDTVTAAVPTVNLSGSIPYAWPPQLEIRTSSGSCSCMVLMRTGPIRCGYSGGLPRKIMGREYSGGPTIAFGA